MSPGRRLHHVALGARSVERVAEFYRVVFGLPELARHHDEHAELRSIWLDAAGVVLMVERTEEAGRQVAGIGAGPFLLAFSVAAADRGRVEQTLAAFGAAVESRTAFTSYARDPEGNRVAISHYPEAADGA